MNLTYVRLLKGKGTVNGVPFDGTIDVSELLGEHDITGEFTTHTHTIESAVQLSAKLYNKTKSLEQSNQELTETINMINTMIGGGQ